MKVKVLFSLLVFSVFFSCKDDKKGGENKEQVKQNFSVEFDVVAETMDDFTVYYTETGTNEFDGTKAVWGGVKGTNADEKITITLPQDVVPTNIRVDFGIKPERKNVTLKKLKFNFFEKSFEIKGSDFFNYFIARPEIKTEVDAANGTVKFIKTPEQKDGTYFYPRQELLDKVRGITK